MNDAVNANDECPFCYVERKLTEDLLDFTLGSSSSYMEADVRDITDRYGFCRKHWKDMYDYGITHVVKKDQRTTLFGYSIATIVKKLFGGRQ